MNGEPWIERALNAAAERWDARPEDTKPIINRDYFFPRADMR